MSYRVNADIPLTFEDGKVLLPLQGKVIDLMKLDTVEEFRVVLCAIAQSALGAMVQQTVPKQQQPAAAPGMGVDLSAEAERIRKEFQDMSDKATERLRQYANVPNANPPKAS